MAFEKVFDDQSRYLCGDEERRATLRRRREDPVNPTTLNGIDFLEVVDGEAAGISPALDLHRQRILLIQCFGDAPQGLEPSNIRIAGGVRTTGIRALWVRRLDDLHQTAGSPQGDLPTPVRDFLQDPDFDRFERSRVLAVGTNVRGDFSTYELGLIAPNDGDPSTPEPRPLAGFDPRLVTVAFAFKVECPSPLDCKHEPDCPPENTAAPDFSYLAKDWSSFRRLMLDRLSVTVPDWKERHAVDQGVATVEMLAWVADQLSYFQDAAVTEAYLGTARRRVSVARHARLVDYFVDQGAAARVWVAFEIDPAADGAVLPGPQSGLTAADRRSGTTVVSRLPGRENAVLAVAERSEARRFGANIFETTETVALFAAHNRMSLYTWSDKDCCLPAGAERATLLGAFPNLQRGDVLVFEEVLGPETGVAADADPTKRHAVRLIEVVESEDPLMTTDPLDPFVVTEIRWHREDAPRFPICISATLDDGTELTDVSVARGNVVLADQGDTLDPETLPVVPEDQDELGPTRFRPLLAEGPLTHNAPLDGVTMPIDADRVTMSADDIPSAAAAVTLGNSAPSVWLDDQTRLWQPRQDLLGSGAFSEDFVAEIEDDGRARLRFGDGEHGLSPAAGTAFEAVYRVGQGPSGNVGADTLSHVLLEPDPGILRVRNPLPAWGGRSPESVEDIRRDAPEAFRVQERAVTAEDYAHIAERHPEISKAAARLRWTGSWTTVFITVDRVGGRKVDEDFEQQIEDFLGRYRLAGQDVEVDGPIFVPLELDLHICVQPGHPRSDVVREVHARLGSGVLADGRCAFFHPDRWTFGRPVYLSPILAEAMAVEGVESVGVDRFQRWGRSADGEKDQGVLDIHSLEIARLDNDPSRPENGVLTLHAGGGR